MQVMWGKHNVAQARAQNFRLNKTQYEGFENEEVLPVVMVRHPLSWMFSTCRHPYAAHWKHSEENCPNLVNKNATRKQLVPLRVKYGWNQGGRNYTRYPSLIHLWKRWYQSYLKDIPFSEFPRLVVRLEDIVYQPEKVMSKICECAGGTRKAIVKVPELSVKVSRERMRRQMGLNGTLTGGKETAGLLTAWIEHASIPALWDRMTTQDKIVVSKVLHGDDSIQRLKYKINF